MAHAGLISLIKEEQESCQEFIGNHLSDVVDWVVEDELEHQSSMIAGWLTCLPDTHPLHQMMQDRLDYLIAVRGMMGDEKAGLLAIVDMDQLTGHVAWMQQVLERLEKDDEPKQTTRPDIGEHTRQK